jgi:hypothetical protein
MIQFYFVPLKTNGPPRHRRKGTETRCFSLSTNLGAYPTVAALFHHQSHHILSAGPLLARRRLLFVVYALHRSMEHIRVHAESRTCMGLWILRDERSTKLRSPGAQGTSRRIQIKCLGTAHPCQMEKDQRSTIYGIFWRLFSLLWPRILDSPVASNLSFELWKGVSDREPTTAIHLVHLRTH